jgi:hypothetical protein
MGFSKARRRRWDVRRVSSTQRGQGQVGRGVEVVLEVDLPPLVSLLVEGLVSLSQDVVLNAAAVT